MSKIIYPNLSYKVQGALYDVFHELRHFDLSEAGWEKALLIALADRQVEESGIDATVRHRRAE